jgi:hypothetical protein
MNAADPERAVITGGCLCGRVRYEVTGRFLRANHCHCSYCRRHSGAAVLTQGRVRREDFRLLSGEASLRAYRPAEGASLKVFCVHCGSSLFGGTWPEGPQVSIRLGSVDGDPGIRPQYHTFVGSRAPWDEITDDLPQHAAALPDPPPGVRRAQVIRDYATQYRDPIQVRTGERVRVGRADDEHPGWVWCTAADGRAGWTPVELLEMDGDSATLRRDYEATELDVRTGDEVSVLDEQHGWLWVRNTAGRSGWIPAASVAREGARARG